MYWLLILIFIVAMENSSIIYYIITSAQHRLTFLHRITHVSTVMVGLPIKMVTTSPKWSVKVCSKADSSNSQIELEKTGLSVKQLVVHSQSHCLGPTYGPIKNTELAC